MFRYNTSVGNLEFYDNAWRSLSLQSGAGEFVSRNGDTMNGGLTMTTGQILLDNGGSVGAPSLAFDTDTNTGVHRPGADQISLVAGGVERLTLVHNGTENLTTGLIKVDQFSLTGTGSLKLNAGSTGQRPPSPINGMIRYNSSLNVFEGYENGSWKTFSVSAGTGFVAKAGDTMTGDLVMNGADVVPQTTLNESVGTSSKIFNEMWATTFNGTATMALYADLAERYAADAIIDVGTVVVFGGEAEITECTRYCDTAVAGVISGKPGVLMNRAAGEDDTHPCVALKGMVPCKVVGSVKKGDLMVTSSVRGHGESAGKKAEPYTAFARALENREAGPKEMGTVMVSII